jgi:hypothetical protein
MARAMLWGAMGHHRFFGLVLACSLPVAAACDPGDEMPPPRTAAAPAAEGTEPASPPPADEQPQSDPTGMYASGEYTIGEETDAYDDNDPSALTDFKPALDPYGTWADDPKYGTVWVPAPSVVGADFVPYQTAGHWAYDDDYVWVSDYDWGWAPFHYGRWVWIEGRGWAWVPGRVYRGAWVAWGVDDGWGYVGWYPLAPSFFWFGGVGVAYTFPIGPHWVYCPRGEIFSPVVGTRIVAGPAVVSIGARVRPFVPASPGVGGGPPPARLGYAQAQIPHATGAGVGAIARAQQFARPSTAQALGARAPSRAAWGAGGRAAGPGPAGGAGFAGSRMPAAAAQQPNTRRKVPGAGVSVPHPSFHGGGGVHMGGHGGGGGHGGHR